MATFWLTMQISFQNMWILILTFGMENSCLRWPCGVVARLRIKRVIVEMLVKTNKAHDHVTHAILLQQFGDCRGFVHHARAVFLIQLGKIGKPFTKSRDDRWGAGLV